MVGIGSEYSLSAALNERILGPIPLHHADRSVLISEARKRPVVKRRTYLGTALAGVAVTLAGCLDGELDEDEVTVIDNWLLDAIDLVDEATLRVSFWFEEPEGVNLEEMATLEPEAGELLDRWDGEIEPKLDSLRETDIDRSVGDETWSVDGDELAAVLEELRWSVEATQTSIGALVEADGDPEPLDDRTQTTLEDLVERGREAVDEAVELWFRDTLEQ